VYSLVTEHDYDNLEMFFVSFTPRGSNACAAVPR